MPTPSYVSNDIKFSLEDLKFAMKKDPEILETNFNETFSQRKSLLRNTSLDFNLIIKL